MNNHSTATYKRALQLCGVSVGDVTINRSKIVCRDDDGNQHEHQNGVSWYKVDSNGLVTARGWISDGLRVSRYGSDKNLTGHVVLPYGGSWSHPFETQFQQFRWKGDFSLG